MEDDPWQVIPTAWIEAAQARWVPGPPLGAHLDAIGVDLARGGPAQTAVAKRYGAWFAPLIKISGRQTIDGPSVAALVYKEYVPVAPSTLTSAPRPEAGPTSRYASTGTSWTRSIQSTTRKAWTCATEAASTGSSTCGQRPTGSSASVLIQCMARTLHCRRTPSYWPIYAPLDIS